MHVTTHIVNPSQNIIDRESEHVLYSFCTTITLLLGKKLSLQNIFIILLENNDLSDIIIDMLGVDSIYELLHAFLKLDPTITKSKYITKYINKKRR